MRTILLTSCAILLLSFSGIGQTKLIYHKSHSGSNSTFSMALEREVFGLDRADFGMAPERTVRNAVLDSLIFISDSVAVMVTSERCVRRNKSTKWKAGKDTVVNHPLFHKKNSLSYIKTNLGLYYFFANPVDSIVFVEEVQEQQEYQTVPVFGFDNHEGGDTTPPAGWLLAIGVCSIAVTSLVFFAKKMLRPVPQV